MKMTALPRVACLALSLAMALSSALSSGLAAQAGEPSRQAREEDAGQRTRSWLSRLAPLSLPGVYERNHAKVKSAFRDVVSAPRQSTVRVLCNGERAALGTVVREDGYVLTKASELNGSIHCQLADGRRFAAELVGLHRDCDLAMLKIDASELTPVRWSEGPLRVGSWLATPGLGAMPEAIGVLSAGSRPIAGPHGVLGVRLSAASHGARVEEVLPGSGAEHAGLKVDDVILGINGQLINTDRALMDAIRHFRPGDRVTLAVTRGDDEMTVTATLGELSKLMHSQEDLQETLGGPLSARRAGFPQALQHDTVLRPYDCGGPLVDLDGQAVGINIARAGRVTSYALPTAAVRPLLDDLISGKYAPDTPGTLPAELVKTSQATDRAAVTEQ